MKNDANVSRRAEFHRPITVYVSHKWADVVNSPSAAEDLAKTVIYEIGLGQEMVAVNMDGIERIIPSCADVLVFLIREALDAAPDPAMVVFVETNDSVWYSIVASCKRYDRGNRLSTQRKPPMVKSIWPRVATIECEGGKVQTQKIADTPPVSSARSVAEFEAERMADDERWAAEWWENNGDCYFVGGVKYATLPIGVPMPYWRTDEVVMVTGRPNPHPRVNSHFIVNGVASVVYSEATVGQFFALLRLIEGLGK